MILMIFIKKSIKNDNFYNFIYKINGQSWITTIDYMSFHSLMQ